ncbi:MAG: hypothetical protein LBL36_04235, partial [Clostridiales Family XIII bacterium]|nr:hypothetical protein [Clostridiales Family XIII bacterium]
WLKMKCEGGDGAVRGRRLYGQPARFVVFEGDGGAVGRTGGLWAFLAPGSRSEARATATRKG